MPLGNARGLPRGGERRSRSSHTKSRNGCLTCRNRRVKCDENRPVCTTCSFRDIQCIYQNGLGNAVQEAGASATTMAEQATLKTPSAVNKSLTGATPQPPTAFLASIQNLSVTDPSHSEKRNYDSQLEPEYENSEGVDQTSKSTQYTPDQHVDQPLSDSSITDLQLLSHFMTQTSSTLSLLKGKQEVWASAVIKLSHTSKCLMHALLSISAIHMVYLEKRSFRKQSPLPTQEGCNARVNIPHLVQLSMKHQSLSVSLMRKEVTSLMEHNIQQVVATSTTLVAFSFAISLASPRQEHHPVSVWPNLEWFRLTRGISSLTPLGWAALRMGPLRRVGRRNMIICDIPVSGTTSCDPNSMLIVVVIVIDIPDLSAVMM
ncbi:hypothetical protein F5884DRAFT_491293 [Xylogone sp. PMI_703]|nr:hypothetical protein F5884DRAFT_491293 [Xylogone sp. PMI_703]